MTVYLWTRLTKRVTLSRKVEGQARRNLSNQSVDKVLNPTSKEEKIRTTRQLYFAI
jgi:hypothetical protein